METKARIISIGRDWKTKKFQIAFETDQQPDEMSGDLRLTYKHWKEKRSLDANAYCWALISQIATEDSRSKEEVYEQFLREYGVLYQDDDGYVVITLKASVDVDKLSGHWRYYKGSGEWSSYLMVKGTSEYDTKEMSRFLDRIIEEAKCRGIETMTPAELERLKNYERQRIN